MNVIRIISLCYVLRRFYMFEVIEELVNPSHYIVRIKYSTDKSKGGGKLNEISD